MKAKKSVEIRHADLAHDVCFRLSELGVTDSDHRVDIALALIASGHPLLRQRKRGTKKKWRSVFLLPGQGWTLDSVRRMLDKPW